MSSLFEDAGALDCPFVDITVKVGGKDVPVTVRNPSAFESDEMDAFFANEYAKNLAEMTTSTNGKACELDTVKAIYSTKPSSEIIEQLLGTRSSDITSLALRRSGLNMVDEALKIQKMTDEEKKPYEAAMQEKLDKFVEEARAEIRAEYDSVSQYDLVERVSQVNINIKALGKSNRALAAEYLYHGLYRPGTDQHAFDNVEQVRQQFSVETIDRLYRQFRTATTEKSTDLPIVSPEESTPDGLTPSLNTSGVVTMTSGEHTATLPEDSKQSITSA